MHTTLSGIKLIYYLMQVKYGVCLWILLIMEHMDIKNLAHYNRLNGVLILMEE